MPDLVSCKNWPKIVFFGNIKMLESLTVLGFDQGTLLYPPWEKSTVKRHFKVISPQSGVPNSVSIL